jgi:hypothetical protein
MYIDCQSIYIIKIDFKIELMLSWSAWIKSELQFASNHSQTYVFWAKDKYRFSDSIQSVFRNGRSVFVLKRAQWVVIEAY